MPLNPLAPVTDYPSMLNRIFWFTTASALGATWLLRENIPALDAAMARVDLALVLEGGKPLPVPGGYLLPALAVGIATRVFRLHARISGWLGIRETFDVEVILRQFARQLAIDLAHVGDEGLRKARPALMRQAFYQFVNGAQPAIDKLLVQQALDAWSWFWIGLEATAIAVVTGLGLNASGNLRAGFPLVGAAVVFAAAGLPALGAQCRRYAAAQVRAILDDPVRAAAVREAFDALAGDAGDQRQAA